MRNVLSILGGMAVLTLVAFYPATTHASSALEPEQPEEPQLLVRVEPRYPPEAVRDRIEGMVIVAFIVDRAGQVQDPTVVRSEPEGVFDLELIRAVRRWRYTDADDYPMTVRIDMTLDDR
ncbi:MAG: energy transducer TonB [Idiomarina sp.]|nr:energy transducer TonB [Idiomarina sp.]